MELYRWSMITLCISSVCEGVHTHYIRLKINYCTTAPLDLKPFQYVQCSVVGRIKLIFSDLFVACYALYSQLPYI